MSGTKVTSPPSPSLMCRSVSSGYLGTEVLHDISFTIDQPSVYVVLGPNGAGKTTLLRTLAGVLPPTRGEVLVEGSRIQTHRAHNRLHYLSHVDGMPDGLRVSEALHFYARAERAAPSDVERVLDQLEIRELQDRYLSQLSAGQKKRVSIARIFLQERGTYLLDEPTANLDPKVAREIRSLILRLSREKIVLYSSHNLYEAREIGRHVLLVKDGRIALFDRIENLRGARFLVGIRAIEPSEALRGFDRQGDYFVRELSGPDQVLPLVRNLDAKGVKIREVREMENPLEDLFA